MLEHLVTDKEEEVGKILMEKILMEKIFMRLRIIMNSRQG
jgi:hypothetical protein